MQLEVKGEGKVKGKLLGEGEAAIQMEEGKKRMQPKGDGKGKILGEGKAHRMSQRARMALGVNEKLVEIEKGANLEFNRRATN